MTVQLIANSFSSYTEEFFKIIIDYSPKIISAFLILIIGLYTIKFINKMVRKIMAQREFDPTLSKFVANILVWVLRVLVFVTFISKLGIETSSFVAILGAAGLAVGLSLQGSLSNFAGGMLIILFKPFRLGDTIEAQSVMGTVIDIQIFVTKLITGNNQTIFVPNGALSNGTIINYSMEGIRRGDLTFSISYDTNIKRAKEIIMNEMSQHPKVLKNPEPSVIVRELSESSIRLGVRPWSNNEDFVNVSSDIIENCKTAFDKEGITFQPFVVETSK
jgi:small conductance mechanosensitive channel